MIETSEITSPDVTISPDGETLVFTALGHLFRIPVNGGDAEQLTFGPFYDEDPTFSPNGTSIAFGSDRGAGHANVFVLTLADGEIRAVTDEFWAARPAWSSDSRSLLYLSHAVGSVRCGGKASIHRIRVDGGRSHALTDRSRVITSAWFAANATPEWVVWEEAEGKPIRSVIERARPDGSILAVTSFEGSADRTAPSRDGAYVIHRVHSWMPRGELVRIDGHGETERIADITRRYCRHAQPRFAVSPDGQYIYLGEEGKLWRYAAVDGSRQEIPFHARIEIEAPVALQVPRVSLRAPVDSFEITSPGRSEGEGLLFGAMAEIWWQASPSEPAKSLTPGLEIARNPVLSPDGKKVAYVRVEDGHQEIVSFRLPDGSRTPLLSGDYFWGLEWHPDGESLVVAQGDEKTYWIVSVDATTGAQEQLVAETGSFFFPPRPHYAPDGRTLYHSAYEDDSVHVYAVDLEGDHSRMLVATFPFYLSNIQVSPEHNFVAFRRNSELWLAALGSIPAAISEESASLISRYGGRSFRFLDSETLLFAEGDAVKEYDVGSKEYRDLRVRVSRKAETAPPLLIENVRVLDFTTGFSAPTSMLLKDGAISRIGNAADRDTLSGIARLDAGGRFAIPGLIDPHIHSEAPFWLAEVEQSAYISYGVTTVRDVGERIDWVRSLAQRSQATSAPLPRYLYTGELFQHFVLGVESPGQYANSSILVHDETTARRSVHEQAARGAQWVKAYASLPMHLFRATADEARRAGLPVIAHGTNSREVVSGVLAGVTFTEHLDGPSRFYSDVHGLLAQSEIYWTPTLSIMGGTRTIGATTDFLESKEGRFFRHLYENEIADLRGGKEHGIRLLIGTDNHETGKVGEKHHTEMKAFSLAGFSSLEVVELATLRAAAALGIEDEVGSIEVGKLADIVLLNRDPLTDIDNTRTIWRVIKGGWVFSPQMLRTR